MKPFNIFYGWKVVGTSVLCYSASPGQFAMGAFSLFIIPLELEFGWSRTEIALTTTFFTIVQAFLNPYFGKLIDRHGSKEILIPTALLFGLLLASIPLMVSEIWHLYVIFALIGVVAGGCSVIPYLRFAGAWFRKNRGLAFGITMSGGGLGYVYTPPLVQYMIDNYGWHSGYYVLAAIIIFISIPLIYLFLRNKPADMNLLPDGEIAETESVVALNKDDPEIHLSDILKDLTFWKLYIIFTFATFCLYGLMLQLVPMLVGRGMDSTNAAVAFSIVGTTIIIARIGIGYLLDKFFAPKLAMVCFLISAIGIAILATGTSGTLVYVAAVLLGFSVGAELDILAYMITRYFGLGSFGLIYGILFTAFLVGVTTGPVAYAATYDFFGSYINVLIASFALLLCTASMMLLLPKYKSE